MHACEITALNSQTLSSLINHDLKVKSMNNNQKR